MPQTIPRNSLVLLTISLFIAITVLGDDTTALHEEDIVMIEMPEENIPNLRPNLRPKRGFKKAGFFRTLFSVIGEQYTDTKDTFRKVNDMINDNFLPENAPVTEATTPSDPNATTTMAPYKITRREFNRIISRNLRGLSRLFNIELQDALKQSEKTRVEYKRNVSKEVSKFL